jgi:ABC-2 type transport system permease protein
MEYISPKKESGSEGKTHVVDHEHWSAFSDFNHQPMTLSKSIKEAFLALISIILWMLFTFWLLLFTSKKAKAI